MATAKDIVVKPITSAAARDVVARWHYSGKSTNNSQLHFGVFLNGLLEGAMQFGPPLDRRKILPLVRDTKSSVSPQAWSPPNSPSVMTNSHFQRRISPFSPTLGPCL